jgi:hypothetical protein
MINKVWKSNFNMVQLLGIVKDDTNYNRRSTLQLCHCFGLLTDDSHSVRPGEEAAHNAVVRSRKERDGRGRARAHFFPCRRPRIFAEPWNATYLLDFSWCLAALVS